MIGAEIRELPENTGDLATLPKAGGGGELLRDNTQAVVCKEEKWPKEWRQEVKVI